MAGYIERFEKLERVWELHLKGFKYTEIARELDITPAHAKNLVDESKEFLKEKAQEDPDLLDRLVENTMAMLETMDMINKEAWATYEKAKDFEMINQQNAGLKNLMDITERRSKLLQLMGVKADSSNTAQLRRAERVNEIVSGIIKDIVADCPRCRVEAQIRLAEAFSLMDREDEAAEMHELNPPRIHVDVEVIDEDLTDQMLGDVFGDD